jgi:predicted nucleotidyltransferase
MPLFQHFSVSAFVLKAFQHLFACARISEVSPSFCPPFFCHTSVCFRKLAVILPQSKIEPVSLLQEMNQKRAAANEALRARTRERLREALRRFKPADRVMVFGSLSKPGHFNASSDIDIALENEPAGMSLYQLTGLLAEEMGRPVDVVVLSECRFRERIKQQAETWMLTA